MKSPGTLGALARIHSPLSLRARLAGFALFCAIPVLMLIALQLRSDTARMHDATVRITANLAEAAKRRLEQDLLSAELIARAIGALRLPDARQGCEPMLSDTVAAAGPRVTNVIVTSPSGDVLCSGRPLTRPANVADRPHMRAALASRQPVVSGFVIGRVSGQGNLQLVMPILDASGQLVSFVVVGLTAANLLSGIEPDGALHPALLLFDRAGTLVQRLPESPQLQAGAELGRSELFQQRERALAQPAELTGVDGVRRVFVTREVRYRGATVAWVAAGAERDALEAQARAGLWRDLAVVALLMLAVVGLAVLAWRPLVLGRYRGLLDVASRVARGDHDSRVPLAVADDLTPVESAVNAMLDAIEGDRAGLAESESRYRQLFENNLDGVLLTQPVGAVLAANPAACHLLGRTHAELVTLSRDDLVDLGDARLEQLLRERDAAGRARGNLRLRRGDGSSFEAEAASSVYRDGSGQLMSCIVFRDVTRQVEAQAQILQLNAELEERVRQRTRELERSNGELQAFASSVSHDLRAPVAAIQVFSRELDERGWVADEKGLHYVRRIRAGADRMGAMIEGLLALAQINREAVRMEPLDISALAQEAAQECRDTEPARAVSVRIDEGITAFGDRRLASSLLSNLLRNAWKFTRDRRDAVITVQAVDADRSGATVICVSDNGVGFDEAHASQLFEPFRRLHRDTEYPGLGIGLATVQWIVYRHGGRVWARSEPDRGAAFYFTLAAAPDGGFSAPSTPPAATG